MLSNSITLGNQFRIERSGAYMRWGHQCHLFTCIQYVERVCGWWIGWNRVKTKKATQSTSKYRKGWKSTGPKCHIECKWGNIIVESSQSDEFFQVCCTCTVHIFRAHDILAAINWESCTVPCTYQIDDVITPSFRRVTCGRVFPSIVLTYVHLFLLPSAFFPQFHTYQP